MYIISDINVMGIEAKLNGLNNTEGWGMIHTEQNSTFQREINMSGAGCQIKQDHVKQGWVQKPN